MSTPLMRMKMNKTQQSQILWLGGLLSLCILFLSLVDPPKSEESKRWSSLSTLSPQEIRTLVITHQDVRWRLTRKSGQWIISEPFDGIADQDKIERLVNNLLAMYHTALTKIAMMEIRCKSLAAWSCATTSMTIAVV